jgi:hypothetical protein
MIRVSSTGEDRRDPSESQAKRGFMTEPIKLEIFTDYV